MSLSEKQRTVLLGLCRGKSLEEVAQDMKVTKPAAYHHLRRAREALGAETNYEAVAIFATTPVVVRGEVTLQPPNLRRKP